MSASKHVVLGGTLVRRSDARLPADDLGFLVGDGVFTTVRVLQGVALFLDAHLARLEEGLRQSRIPSPFDTGALRSQVERLIAAEPATAASARLRITVSRGPGTPPATASGDTTVLVAIDPWLERAETAGGVAVERSRRVREPHPLHSIKSTSQASNLWLRREAAAAETFDVLECNTRGDVAEGSFTNVFVVDERGQLWTPAPEDGCLPGITRDIVIELAERTGHPCRVGGVAASRLPAARELFLTSSLIGVVPVRTLDGATVGPACPGPTTAALAAAYKSHVATAIAAAHAGTRTRSPDVV
jgi:branched-subunit amino acid aminotransferase/4-amino-4-deoxychorismate lyase